MGTYDEAVKATKQIAVTSLKTSIDGVLIEAFPFLGVPPFSGLLDKGLNWVLTKAVDKAEFGAFVLRTDLRVDSQGKEYLEAVIRNQKAQLGTDEQEKKDAIKNLDDKFDAFIVLRN